MTTKFCPGCGKPTDGSKFCTGCGRDLGSDVAQSTHTPTSTASAEVGSSAPGPAAQATGPVGQAPVPHTRRWLPVGIGAAIVLALAGITAAVLVAVGGSGSVKTTAAPNTSQLVKRRADAIANSSLYIPFETPQLVAVVPAGWQITKPGTWVEKTTAASVSIAARHGGPSAGGRARATKAQLAARPGFKADFFGRTRLPGGRSAWRLNYTTSQARGVDYFIDSCGTGLGLSASAAPASFPRMQPRFSVIAESLAAKC